MVYCILYGQRFLRRAKPATRAGSSWFFGSTSSNPLTYKHVIIRTYGPAVYLFHHAANVTEPVLAELVERSPPLQVATRNAHYREDIGYAPNNEHETTSITTIEATPPQRRHTLGSFGHWAPYEEPVVTTFLREDSPDPALLHQRRQTGCFASTPQRMLQSTS